MGSTLRSLVLRYKAEIKEFQKGNRRVIDDIKQTKRDVVGLDKELKKAFTPKVDKARDQIKRLNEQFRAGKMDVHKYGIAVDALKQKIAAMNRVSGIASHEVGVLRANRFAAATRNQTLARAFGGNANGMSIAQMLASAPEAAPTGKAGSTFFGAPSKDVKKLWKRMMPFTGAMAAAKIYGDARASTEDMAMKPLGSWDRAAGGAVKPGFDFMAGIHKLPGKGLATGLGAIADMLSGGAITRTAGIHKETAGIMARNSAMEQKFAMQDAAMRPQNEFQDQLDKQREIDALVKSRTVGELKAAQQIALQKKEYEQVHTLSLAIVAAKEKNIAAAERERQLEEAKAATIRGMLDDLKAEQTFGALLDSGLSPEAARVKMAGGSDKDVGDAQFMSDQLAQRQRALEGARELQDLIEISERAAADRAKELKAQRERDRMSVQQFGNQFRTPQELFQDNLKEIQSMMTLGLDPALAKRAMMANAQGLVGSEGGRFNRFAPSAEVGSREEMMMRDQAKAANKQEKKLNELVEIQKKALEVAKEKGAPVKIEHIEVSI